MGDAVGFRLRQRGRHLALIDLVRTGKRDAHDDRRQARGLKLRAQQALAHAMHADAREFVGHGGERADNVVIAIAANFMQREGAVLAARPGDQCLWLVLAHAALRSVADARHAERHVLPLRPHVGCRCRRGGAFCFGAAAGASCLGDARHDTQHPQGGIGRALARFPGAADRAVQGLVRGFARVIDAIRASAPSGCGATAGRRARPPRRRPSHRARTPIASHACA